MILLVINGTYTTLEVALIKEQQQFLASTQHIFASTRLLPMIDELCAQNKIELNQVTAIAANVGPGPFTTLRTVIATVNGLGYATQVLLIAVNGIEAWVQSEAHFSATSEYTHTFALLNAFCGDVYYAHYDHALKETTSGSCSIEYWVELLRTFLQHYPSARIKFIGNGYMLYQKEISTAFGMHAIPEQAPAVPTIEAIIAAAKRQWESHSGICSQLTPLYLKTYIPHKK